MNISIELSGKESIFCLTSVSFAGEEQVVPFIQRPGNNTQLLLQTIQDHYGRRRICTIHKRKKKRKSNLISKASKREGSARTIVLLYQHSNQSIPFGLGLAFMFDSRARKVHYCGIYQKRLHKHTGYDDGSTL